MLGRKKRSGTSKTNELLPVQPSLTFLCFESPTALFGSQRNLVRTMLLDSAKGLSPEIEDDFGHQAGGEQLYTFFIRIFRL